MPERKIDHPLGCHRRRISDRVVFEKLVQILVFGCAYERIADAFCSESTLRRRRDEWIELGVMERLKEISLDAYDRLIDLELADLAVDGCLTKAPCGGEKAGRSPVDRAKVGIKRSMAVDAWGIPLGAVTAPANRHDSPLLVLTLETVSEALGALPEGASVHLDRGYDSRLTRERLAELELGWEISGKGKPAAFWATKRPKAMNHTTLAALTLTDYGALRQWRFRGLQAAIFGVGWEPTYKGLKPVVGIGQQEVPPLERGAPYALLHGCCTTSLEHDYAFFCYSRFTCK